MKEIMKIFLLFALLQLCLSTKDKTGKYEGDLRKPIPGDILRFDRKCLGTTFYSHYAIYLGDVKVEGKKEGEDIFEMTKVDGETGCRFGKLKGDYRIYNYKDDEARPQKTEQIVAAIPDVAKCKKWKLGNTCEDVATSLRYGEAHRQCNQEGTQAEMFCKFIMTVSKKDLDLPVWYPRPAAAAAA